MSLMPNRQLIMVLLGCLPIVVLGVVFIDALHWAWLWKRGLLTPIERRKRLRRYMLLSTAGIGTLAVSQFTRDLLADRLWWHTAGYPVLFVVSALVVLLHPSYRKPTEKDVEKHFGQNPGHCGRCDYDLTGNVSGVCPECGWLIPPAPPHVEDPDWWCWWRKWNIEYLERWRRSFVSHVLLALLSLGTAAATVFVYTLLGPIVIIDPVTGLGRLHRPWYVYTLLVAAAVLAALGLHAAVIAVRVVMYRRREKAR